MTGEATLLDLRREYHCAAYNLLVSVVSCTQTDAKFYAVFLFGENEAKVCISCINIYTLKMLGGYVFFTLFHDYTSGFQF